MNNGFILLHRKLLDNWIFDNPEYFRAWIAILMAVNHAEKKVLIKGDLITCKRGESLKSIESWCKLFARDWTRQKVRTFFKLLEKDQMINQQGLLNTTKLSVCNYDTYQSKQPTDNQRTNQQITNRQPTDNQQITTNNNVNNENNDKNKELFEVFRKNYPGTKSGLETEYKNFTKKHKNSNEIVLVLNDLLQKQIDIKKINKASGGFVPEWKNLSTYINQSCWEQEIPIDQQPQQPQVLDFFPGQ